MERKFQLTIISNPEVQIEDQDVLDAEQLLNTTAFRFHIDNEAPYPWVKIDNSNPTTLPEMGQEYLGFHQEWVHPDFNPDGICLFVRFDDYYIVGMWDSCADEWETRSSEPENDKSRVYNCYCPAPEYWMHKTLPPVKILDVWNNS